MLKLLNLYKKFFIIGVTGAILHYLIAHFLYSMFVLNQILSNTSGFVIAVIYSYYLNTSYTFNVKKTYVNGIKYTIVVSLGLIISNFVIFYVELISDSFNLALFVAIVIGSTFNFIGHNYFSFKR
jgi:putative flippase GtrA